MATPIRNIRVADDTWTAAARIAAARGVTVTDVVRASLERYVRRNRALDPLDPGHVHTGSPQCTICGEIPF